MPGGRTGPSRSATRRSAWSATSRAGPTSSSASRSQPKRGQLRRTSDGFDRAGIRFGGDVRERRLAKFRQNVARFRLYRLRFLQENMRFAAFFKIYQILKVKFLKIDKILQISKHTEMYTIHCRYVARYVTIGGPLIAYLCGLLQCSGPEMRTPL